MLFVNITIPPPTDIMQADGGICLWKVFYRPSAAGLAQSNSSRNSSRIFTA